MTETSATETATASSPPSRIIKKFGGRHLIFRTTPESLRLIPHPYVLISSISGPVWAFYGLGQVWLTHKKQPTVGGWTVRAPRFRGKDVLTITDALRPDLEAFVNYCNETGIEGTILIEKKVIEFHWTFGFELEKEKLKDQNAETLDAKFHELTSRYAEVKRDLSC